MDFFYRNLGRWEAIAKYINSHIGPEGTEKTAQQVIAKVKSMKKIGTHAGMVVMVMAAMVIVVVVMYTLLSRCK